VYGGATVELFIDGNRMEGLPRPIKMQSELVLLRPGCSLTLREEPLPFATSEKVMPAHEVYRSVLENAGATKPRRDAVDSRIVAGVKEGTGRQPDSLPPDAWPRLRSTEEE
jgi:hypothetical protein